MKKRVPFHLSMLLMVSALCYGCEGDCRTEEIEQVEWVTYNKSYYTDTLVRYEVIEDSTEYQKDLKQVLHTVVIRNLDRTYGNIFVVTSTMIIVDEQGDEQIHTQLMDSVEIPSGDSHEFRSYGQAIDTKNFNGSVRIRQLPKWVLLTKRMDSLRISYISANICMTDIEALKVKAQTIRNLYNKKTSKSTH